MSFGFSIGDAVVLTQLASRAVQNSRKACGAHDELTHELSSIQLVLGRLKDEVAKAESPINRPGDSCTEELQSLVVGCQKVLKVLENIMLKYNSLSQEERNGRKLWQRIRFGNGEMQDLAELRSKLTYYTSALSLFLNMVSVGSIGRVEKRMNEAGGDLKEIRLAVNGITAHLLASKDREGSVLTTYADDDRAVWKEFRRELVIEGFSSSTISKHKGLIKAYIKELAGRGLLDEDDPYYQEDLRDRINQDTVNLSENGKNPPLVSSPDENTADAVLESGQQVYIHQQRLNLEREKQEQNVREAEIAGLRAGRDAGTVHHDTKETLSLAERRSMRQELEELVKEQVRPREEQEDQERLQAAEFLEEIHLDDEASFHVKAFAPETNTDLKTRTVQAKTSNVHAKFPKRDTSWTPLRLDDDAGSSKPPAWLLYEEQSFHPSCRDEFKHYHPMLIFVAAPFGICVTLHRRAPNQDGYNLSLMLCQLRWRADCIRRGLAVPLVSCILRCENGPKAPRYIFSDLQRLRSLEDRLRRIVVGLTRSDTKLMTVSTSLLDSHRLILNEVVLSLRIYDTWIDTHRRFIDNYVLDIHDEINSWIRDYEVDCLAIFSCIRHWSRISILEMGETKTTHECNQSSRIDNSSLEGFWDGIRMDLLRKRTSSKDDHWIDRFCERTAANANRVRADGKELRASMALESSDKQLSKWWRRHYYLQVAPICRDFLLVPAGGAGICKVAYRRTLDMLRELVEEDYLVKLDFIDVRGDLFLMEKKQQALREGQELLTAIMESWDLLNELTRLESLERLYYSEIEPECVRFVCNEPRSMEAKDHNFNKLIHSIQDRVITQLDATEATGDRELTARRKQLMDKAFETQGETLLSRVIMELDAMKAVRNWELTPTRENLTHKARATLEKLDKAVETWIKAGALPRRNDQVIKHVKGPYIHDSPGLLTLVAESNAADCYSSNEDNGIHQNLITKKRCQLYTE